MIHFVCSPSSSCQAGISPRRVAGISAILQASSFCCRWSALNITCLQLLGVCLVSSQLALPWEIYATSLQAPPAEHHRPNQRAPPIDDDDDLSKAYSRVSKCSIHALCETELAHLLRTVASACLCASPVNVESCQMVKSVIYKASCQVQWHLMAFASSPSACSKSFRPRLQLLHRNAGISLFNPLQPRRPFGVDRLTSAVVQSDSSNPTKTDRKPHKGRHTTSKFVAILLQLRGCFAEWLGFRRRSSLCPGPRDLDATQISHIMPNILRPYLEISRITHALLCTRQHDVHPTIVGQESWFAWTRSEHRVGFIDIHRISITVTMNEWFGKTCRIQKLPQLNFTILHLWRTRTFIVIIFFQLNNLKPSAHGNITVSRNYDSARGS